MASLAAKKRLIKEDGVVLSKVFKDKMDSFINSKGETIDAQPDRYVLLIASNSAKISFGQ